MKSLIIGGSGFVGGYLIERLLSSGYDVYVTKTINEKMNISTDYTVLDVDVRESKEISDILRSVKPDYIYYLAAQSSVKKSWENPVLTVDVNVKGVINLLNAVRDNCSKAKVLIIGSGDQYGDVDYNKPISENVQPKPQSVYGITKYAQEMFAQIYCRAYNLNVIMTRSFNHAGPKQLNNFVVADFCCQVAKIEKGLQKPIIKVGNLNAYRDFSDVRDIVRAYELLAEKGVSGEVYNVGSGNVIRISDILKYILQLSKIPIKIEVDELKFRPIDIESINVNVDKLSLLGYKPEIGINKTIEDTLNYYREIL